LGKTLSNFLCPRKTYLCPPAPTLTIREKIMADLELISRLMF
jgi:hypothetical protein